MKLSILQSKLKQGVNFVKNITSKSSTLPILNNVFLKAKGNFLNLIATDLEVGINWWILTKIEQEGEIVVPGKIFSDFIGLLPERAIELSVENNILSINAENYKTKIKGVSSENFPIIPKTGKEEWVSVESYPFCQSLSQVVDFTAPSTTRPEISGVYLSFEKSNLTMATTDSFRLGEKKISLEKFSNLSKKRSLILPQRTVRELINIFSEKEGEIKIFFEENQIMFERRLEETDHPQVQLVSKLIEGEYPKYEEIIPKKYKTEVILKREEFLNHIKTASLFSGRINEIKIKVNPSKNRVEFFCQNAELGERRSHLEGKIKGKEGNISFNHRFLVDGVLNIKTPEIFFALSEKKEGEEGPGVLKPVGKDNYTYIAMPIQSS